MDRIYQIKEIASAHAELQRLRDERTRLAPGDREGTTRYRQMIDAAGAEVRDLEAELAEHDAHEGSAARVAERECGRASAAYANKTLADTVDLWANLHEALAVARAAAEELKARGEEAKGAVDKTLRVHYGQDVDRLLSKSAVVYPNTEGSDGGTVEALAFQLKALIEALPGGARLAREWLLPNYYAFARAKPLAALPSLHDARIAAANNVHMHLSTLCQEMAPVEERYRL